MSSHLRHDNECQNCGYAVDVAYCSKCGQKNTETRQPFHHLFTHFVEDLTHYDSNFWKTIKYLLFRPARLTKEYLEGHRQRYVPPVKLYIFISFVTFFLASVLPDDDEIKINTNEISDNKSEPIEIKKGLKMPFIDGNTYITVREFDSIQKLKPEAEKLSSFQYTAARRALTIYENNTSEQMWDKIYDAVDRAMPKILFIYMPIFAFWLWSFHGKKRWYFFDHGIFTLHYFSFLLLLITIGMLVNWPINYAKSNFLITFSNVISFLSFTYAFFYFFRAHKRFYSEGLIISGLKTTALIFINLVCIVVMIIATMLYILFTLH